MPNKDNRKRKNYEINELKVKLKRLEQSVSSARQSRRPRRRIKVISSSSDSASSPPSSPPKNVTRIGRAARSRSQRAYSRSATRSSGRRRSRQRSRSPRERRRLLSSSSRSVSPIVSPTATRQVDHSDADLNVEDESSTRARVVVAQAQIHAPTTTSPSTAPAILPDEVIESANLTQEAITAPLDADNPVEPELSMDILDILGDDPSKPKNLGSDIQKDLAIRFEHIATNGLTKELRKELREKYPLPANCTLIDAPQINPEVKAAISETASKRLSGMEQKQKQLASAISCLGEAITLLISQNNADPRLLKYLMDSCRLLCDTQYSDSLTRRFFILSSLKKDIKDQLLQTKIDQFLFGKNLSETLKSAKAITKSGAELKPSFVPSKQTTWKIYNKTGYKKNNLNTKTPPSSNRSTGSTRPRAPAPKNQPVSSSRSSRPMPRRRRSHR